MKHWKTNFILIAAGQAVSMLTSSILQISVVWYLTQQTQSPTIVTLSTLAGYLPRAVLGLFTGSFIDRWDRKKILMLSDGLIALAALCLAVVGWRGAIPIGLIFATLCLRSVGAAFHSPAFQAVVPSMVPREQLARCAGITQGFESISLLLSPALAAMLFTIWDLSAIVLLDVAGAAVAIAIVSLLPIPRQAAPQEDRPHQGVWQDTREGFQVIRRDRTLTAILVISTLYAFIYFPIGSMYPLITMTYFGGTVAQSGMVEIAFSGGSILGAVALGMVGDKIKGRGRIGAIATSIGIYGLGAAAVGLLPPGGLTPFAALSVGMGMTIPFFYGLRTATFQASVPNQYLGRVLSLLYSVSLFAGPVGLLFGGAFSEWLGVNRCFLILGLLALGLSFSLGRLLLAQKNQSAHPQPE